MRNCSIPGCRNNSKNKKLSFFQFPRIPFYHKKWVKSCKMAKLITKNSLICSEHFTLTCFEEKIKKQKLIPSAVPTLNLPVDLDETCHLRVLALSRQRNRCSVESSPTVDEKLKESNVPSLPEFDESILSGNEFNDNFMDEERLMELSKDESVQVESSLFYSTQETSAQTDSLDTIDKSTQADELHKPFERFSLLKYLGTQKDLFDLTGVRREQLEHLEISIKRLADSKNIVFSNKYALSLEEMIIMTLAKLRHDLTNKFTRLLFGTSDSACGNYFSIIMPLLADLPEQPIDWIKKKDHILKLFRGKTVIKDKT